MDPCHTTFALYELRDLIFIACTSEMLFNLRATCKLFRDHISTSEPVAATLCFEDPQLPLDAPSESDGPREFLFNSLVLQPKLAPSSPMDTPFVKFSFLPSSAKRFDTTKDNEQSLLLICQLSKPAAVSVGVYLSEPDTPGALDFISVHNEDGVTVRDVLEEIVASRSKLIQRGKITAGTNIQEKIAVPAGIWVSEEEIQDGESVTIFEEYESVEDWLS